MSHLSAVVVRRWYIISAALLITVLVLWSVRHVLNLLGILSKGGEVSWIWLFAFALVFMQMFLSFLEKPFVPKIEDQEVLDTACLVVNVPVYNEDPEILRNCLYSLLNQSRKPNCIFVVDDGSTVDYSEVKSWFVAQAASLGMTYKWERQPNAGKRHAQGRTVNGSPEADFYLTVDSDAFLDHRAVEEGLKPFAKPEVQSVAGVVMVSNRVNFLTKMTDLWFLIGQLVDRSSMSAIGAVLVNSGVLAFYRASLLRDNLEGYLNEEFFGRRVELSDDSMLTIYALLRGKAVQQQTAFAFTMMPETYSHHRRQYLRWMRGAFIRTWWRFKYLPLCSFAYWLHFLSWVQMVLSTVTFGVLFVYAPLVVPEAVPFFIIVPLLVGYGQALRYFMVRRSDMSIKEQSLMYALTPVVVLYGFFVLRVLRFYAIFTCLKTGWGTRQKVEVSAES